MSPLLGFCCSLFAFSLESYVENIVTEEDGGESSKSTLFTDFDTTIIVRWLPRSYPLSNRERRYSGLGNFGACQ